MALTQVDQGLLGSNAQYTGFKNRIINGAMVIDQRNAGAAVTGINGAGIYDVDRWRSGSTYTWGGSGGTGVFTFQQNKGSVTPPSGFTKYLGISPTTADATLPGNTAYDLTQVIEGYNIADLSWGSSSAKTVTLSFWVYSNLTGTFGGTVANNAQDRYYVFSYTISSSNTWEYKTITIAGDQSGTWTTDNTAGIRLNFSIGAGSARLTTAGSWGAGPYSGPTGQQNVAGSTSNNFYITGVQLEKGSTATSFDYRPYGTELALCQRYYYKQQATGAFMDFGVGWVDNSTVGNCVTTFPVQMRTTPSSLEQSGTASHYQVVYASAATTCNTVPTFAIASVWNARTQFYVSSGLTSGQGCGGRAANTTSAYLAWSAEL